MMHITQFNLFFLPITNKVWSRCAASFYFINFINKIKDLLRLNKCFWLNDKLGWVYSSVRFWLVLGSWINSMSWSCLSNPIQHQSLSLSLSCSLSWKILDLLFFLPLQSHQFVTWSFIFPQSPLPPMHVWSPRFGLRSLTDQSLYLIADHPKSLARLTRNRP
jgi:hypothetical protein